MVKPTKLFQDKDPSQPIIPGIDIGSESVYHTDGVEQHIYQVYTYIRGN